MKKQSSRINLCSFAAALAIGLLLSVSVLAQSTAASDIHRVDFRNFTYHPTCWNWEDSDYRAAVKVTNGSFKKKNSDGDVVTLEVTDVVYGDLDGDGMDEAVAVTDCNTGGTSWFFDGFVYAMRNGKPVLLSRIQGGDRANGGIRAVRIEGGLLLVERLGSTLGQAIGAEFIDTTSYRLKGKKLLQVGRPVRRTLRGERKARRIQFGKGETSAVLTGATRTADFYVLRALEHQTLTVRITSKLNNARFELIVGDATFAYRATDWSGKLDSRGDYYIVVVSSKGVADYSLEVGVH